MEIRDVGVGQFRDECKALISESKKDIEKIVEDKIQTINQTRSVHKDCITALEKSADNSKQEHPIVIEIPVSENVRKVITRRLDIKNTEEIKFAMQFGKET